MTGATNSVFRNYRQWISFLGKGDLVGNMKKPPIGREAKKSCHRHSPQQIYHLEAFFKECPHPDEKQRQQLSRNLGLEPKQIKFWFQNKRTQIKAQSERADNSVLKVENDRIECEILAMKDALNHLVCRTCNDKKLGEEDRQRNLQKLQSENALLKGEYERLYNAVAPFIGKPSALVSSSIQSIMSSSERNFLSQGMGVPSADPALAGRTSMDLMFSYMGGRQDMEKSQMVEIAATATKELLMLLRENEPLWIKASPNGRCFLDTDFYNKHYPKEETFKNSGAWIESSKESGIVPMTAGDLFEILSDPRKWMDIFPTIVTKVREIGTLDTGSYGGSLHLLYVKLHVLSPMVVPREYIFLRYSCQLDPSTWIIADASYDFLSKLQMPNVSVGSWRLPSGCLIQEIPNGSAKVTWVEHVQVDGKSFSDPILTELIWSSQAFGAKRWIVTLERMYERFAFSMETRTMAISEPEAVDAHNGRRSLMDLSHRMVKNFFEILSTPKKVDLGYLTQLNDSDILVSVRESSVPGQPQGTIVCLATTLQLPVFYENLFAFFKDEKTRAQWDVFSGGNGVDEMIRIATGAYPGNCISLLKPSYPRENTVMILQESWIDPLEGVVIYAPVDMIAIGRGLNGEDTSQTPILPSGFIISCDGALGGVGGASTSSSSARIRSSILTSVFQILLSETTPKELNMEIMGNMHSIISNSIGKIKMAMGLV